MFRVVPGAVVPIPTLPDDGQGNVFVWAVTREGTTVTAIIAAKIAG
jgi:hypothetical protein